MISKKSFIWLLALILVSGFVTSQSCSTPITKYLNYGPDSLFTSPRNLTQNYCKGLWRQVGSCCSDAAIIQAAKYQNFLYSLDEMSLNYMSDEFFKKIVKSKKAYPELFKRPHMQLILKYQNREAFTKVFIPTMKTYFDATQAVRSSALCSMCTIHNPTFTTHNRIAISWTTCMGFYQQAKPYIAEVNSLYSALAMMVKVIQSKKLDAATQRKFSIGWIKDFEAIGKKPATYHITKLFRAPNQLEQFKALMGICNNHLNAIKDYSDNLLEDTFIIIKKNFDSLVKNLNARLDVPWPTSATFPEPVLKIGEGAADTEVLLQPVDALYATYLNLPGSDLAVESKKKKAINPGFTFP